MKAPSLMPERVVAEAARALFVVAQRLQGAAERRVRDAPQQPHAGDDAGQREGVEGGIAGQHRPRHALQPVLAARQVGPFEGDLEGDLRKRQGQQREIQAAAAQDDDADDRRQHDTRTPRRRRSPRSRCSRKRSIDTAAA